MSGVKRMKQNSAYLLLYERKEPLETEDFAPQMESRGAKMGTGVGRGVGVEKESKLSTFPSSSMTSEALLCAEEEVEEEEGEVEGEVQEGDEDEKVEGEVEGGSESDGLYEVEKAAEEERKRSSDADVMMYRYPSETKGEGDDEGKREEDDDREVEAREGEGEKGEGDAEKERIRRVNFSADSWDEYEIKKEQSVTQENPQVKNTHTTNNTQDTHEGSGAHLQPESGIRSRVRTRITDFPPIAKKVLQAVWTENLEFQTDRSLFNRCVTCHKIPFPISALLSFSHLLSLQVHLFSS